MVLDGKYLFVPLILLLFLIAFPACAMTPIWNISNSREIISDLALAADGSRLITGTLTGIATVYNQNGTIIWNTQVPGALLVGCHENGSAFILGSQEDIYSNKGAVRSYDRNGSEIWYAPTGHVAALAIAGKSNRTVIGNREGDIIVLDGQGKELAKFNDFPQTNVVADISVSDNGKIFAYALYERYPEVRYAYIDTQKKGYIKGLYTGSKTGYGGGERINAIALSSDGQYVTTSNGEGTQGTLCLYGNGKMIWAKDMDEITDIAIGAIGANGSIVYAGTVNGEILGYSLSGNSSFAYSSGSAITDLSLATDKNLLAAGNANGNLYLFNDTGSLIWTYQIEEFPVAKISKVEISRDGTSLVVLVNKKNLYYFRQESETPKITVTLGPPTPISSPTQSSQSAILIALSLFTILIRARRR